MKIIKETLQFGGRRPIRDFIGSRTLEVLASPDRIESYIIEDGPKRREVGFVGCTVLAEGPLLDDDQVARLRECVFNPAAYYNGDPIFRRFPSVPNFAFRVWRGIRVVDVLIDLHNPGWEFHCGTERYADWNWVRGEMSCLAKELFPQFASSNSQSVWRKGAIKALRDKAREERTAINKM